MDKKTEKHLVNISIDSVILEGELGIPEGAIGIVLFAHGSGSSRLSPRNNFVARELRKGGIATLLFDLLTEEEDIEYSTRFNINLLTQRLRATTLWLQKQPEAENLKIGYFGASTGAAAALKVAAELGNKISAVVSRGGRPDLAIPELKNVKSPTLFIVGGEDDLVIELNRAAYAELKGSKELVIIPGATHLFEEPGALEEVARLATDWFNRYFSRNENYKW